MPGAVRIVHKPVGELLRRRRPVVLYADVQSNGSPGVAIPVFSMIETPAALRGKHAVERRHGR